MVKLIKRNVWLGLLFFLLTSLSLAGQAASTAHVRLRVNVEGVDEKGGAIHLAVHTSENFLGKAITGLILPVMGESRVSGLLKALPHNTYAIAAYQDMNGNNRLDKNALGIPSEPYAFSNNPSVKWSPPSFGEACVVVNQAEQAITVTLKYWKDY